MFIFYVLIWRLPTPFVPDISLAKDYITDGVSIGLIAFVYSISVALIFSQKEGYDIDANQASILCFGNYIETLSG